MSAHVILFGPSTAGKTSLMIGLTHVEGLSHRFTIDKTWTTRHRRLREGDEENIFVGPAGFEAERPNFMQIFESYGHYYGIPHPIPLEPKEVRMRILRPLLARQFRILVPEPVIFCAISPFSIDPEGIMYRRDPMIDPAEMHARADRFFDDEREASVAADLHFFNRLGLDGAVHDLARMITSHLVELDL